MKKGSVEVLGKLTRGRCSIEQIIRYQERTRIVALK